jgi:hypothetical protein
MFHKVKSAIFCGQRRHDLVPKPQPLQNTGFFDPVGFYVGRATVPTTTDSRIDDGALSCAWVSEQAEKTPNNTGARCNRKCFGTDVVYSPATVKQNNKSAG